MRLFMGGQVHTGDSPLLKNLFTEVLDTPEQVLPKAMELAKELAKDNSLVSMALIKNLIWRNPGQPEVNSILNAATYYFPFLTLFKTYLR